MRKIVKEIMRQNSIFDENKEFKDKRKKMFFSFFSFIAIFIFGFFTVFHFFFVDNIVLAYCLLTTFLLFLFNLVYYYKSKNIDLSSTIIIIVSIILLSISVINGGYKNSGIYWIFVIPIVSFYYKGKKAGSVLCVVFFAILLSILVLSEYDVVKTSYSAGYFSIVLAVYLFLSLMIYFYEDTANVSENIIRKQVYTDTLTRLPNRNKLIEDLTCSDKQELVLINVDDFKQINDIYGANIGDQVLVELSNRLKFTLNNLNCEIYKLHADEFAVLFPNQIRKSELFNYSQRIHKELTRDIIINKLEIIVNVSIGVAKGIFDALSCADIALKMAKENKKDVVFFDKSMDVKERYANNLKWIKIIKKALLFDNLVPYYQPIINNLTGVIDKYECLIRLLDKDKPISPFFFLDIAKRSKIYPHITKIVLLKSFETFKNSNHHFSVNITVDDIINKSTRDFIYTTMKDYNNSKNVVFEIVESEKIEDIDEVYDFIKAVKALGGKIAIDDFGSGYSNYEYILRLNVDYIKIDASLIKNIATDKNSQILIETIVDFTKKLNIQTIAEFVHSKEVYEKVKNLKIDFSQGYYLGEPGPKILK